VLVLYLAALGLDERRIGLLLSLTLLGDTAISLWVGPHSEAGTQEHGGEYRCNRPGEVVCGLIEN
jgi:hypothetical protein